MKENIEVPRINALNKKSLMADELGKLLLYQPNIRYITSLEELAQFGKKSKKIEKREFDENLDRDNLVFVRAESVDLKYTHDGHLVLPTIATGVKSGRIDVGDELLEAYTRRETKHFTLNGVVQSHFDNKNGDDIKNILL